ncbi:hypothetical protein NPIL_373651 [Nephila pilipes]|uniref:Uncharacterized protein n=1 Tax=Nephila pilipes TaxID=299642 RepID=A0A8X6MW23_NEPPI|nr:hypothetical protein NPIL_373651 [Nephila pilipes]
MLTDCFTIHRNPNQDIPYQFAHVPLGHSTGQQYRTLHSGHNIPTTGDSHTHSSRLLRIPPDGAADQRDVTARVFSDPPRRRTCVVKSHGDPNSRINVMRKLGVGIQAQELCPRHLTRFKIRRQKKIWFPFKM